MTQFSGKGIFRDIKARKKRLTFNKITIHSSCRQLIMQEKCRCSMANGFMFKGIKADKKILGSDFIHQGPIFFRFNGLSMPHITLETIRP